MAAVSGAKTFSTNSRMLGSISTMPFRKVTIQIGKKGASVKLCSSPLPCKPGLMSGRSVGGHTTIGEACPNCQSASRQIKLRSMGSAEAHFLSAAAIESDTLLANNSFENAIAESLPSFTHRETEIPEAASSEMPVKKIFSCFVRPVVNVCLYPLLTAQALGLPIQAVLDPAFLAAVASSAYGIYAYDRIKDNVEDHINDPSRTSWVQTHRSALWVSVLAAISVASACVIVMPLPQQIVMSFLMALGYGYTVPCLPGGHSFRTAPAGKTITMIAWSVMAVIGMPLLSPFVSAATTSFTPLMVAAMAGHVMLTNTDSLFNDLRDIPGDAESGTISIPVMLGREKTLALIKTFAVFEGLFKLAVLKSPLLLLVNALLYARATRLEEKDKASSRVEGFSLLNDQFAFYVSLVTVTLGQLALGTPLM